VAMKVNILMGGGWVCCYEREREREREQLLSWAMSLEKIRLVDSKYGSNF